MSATEAKTVESSTAAAAPVEAAAPVAAPVAAPKSERKAGPVALIDGDHAFIAATCLSVASFGLSFGSVSGTQAVATLVANNNTRSSVMQTYLAFSYLYLIASGYLAYLFIMALVGEPAARKKGIMMQNALTMLVIAFLIIAVACFGGVVDISATTESQYISACLISAIVANVALIYALSIAKKDYEASAPSAPLALDAHSVSLLSWVAVMAALNLAFAVGCVWYLIMSCVHKSTAKETPYCVITFDMESQTGWAFVLVYLVISVAVAFLSIVSLVPLIGLSTLQAVTATWALALLAFCTGLIGFGFSNSMFPTMAYINGMLIGGFLSALITFILGCTVYVRLAGRACCAECANDGPSATDPISDAQRELEMEKVRLETARIRKERAALEAV